MSLRTSGRAVAAAVVGAAVVIAFAAGCSAGNGVAAGHGTTGGRAPLVTGTPSVTPSHARTIDGLELPIFAYDASGKERAVVTNAIDALASRCMARFGFTVHQLKVRATRFDKQQMRRMWGVMKLSDAERYGYHVPHALGGGQDHAHAAEAGGGGSVGAPARMSKAERLVMYGSARPALPNAKPTASPGTHDGKAIPPGGCQGQAKRKLGAQHFDPNKLTDPIMVGMFQRTKNDPRVKEVFGQWSACMAQQGYHYRTPEDATGDKRWGDLIGGSPTQREIATATADVRCKQSTNLIGVTFSVDSAYEKAAIAKKLPQLTQHRQKWKSIVGKAAHALGVPAPR